MAGGEVGVRSSEIEDRSLETEFGARRSDLGDRCSAALGRRLHLSPRIERLCVSEVLSVAG